MKPTKKMDKEFRTVYSVNGQTVMHCYDPKKDINKKHDDYLCYLHDRVVPYADNANVSVTIEDNPHKKTNKKEKYGKMFRCATKSDATAVIEAICALIPADAIKSAAKKPAKKNKKKESGVVFTNVTPAATPAPKKEEENA